MSDAGDTTHFSVHSTGQEQRRQPFENTEEYGDCILAQFDDQFDETQRQSPFVPRSRPPRTLEVTSTPVAKGKESPEGLNLGGTVSPVREAGTASTEQRYEAFRKAAEGRGEKTLGELRTHAERLQREREDEAERQRALQEEQQLEDEVKFKCARREKEADELRKRRKAARARELARLQQHALEEEEELAEVEQQRQLCERIAALQVRRQQLSTTTSPIFRPITPTTSVPEANLVTASLVDTRPIL
ncbi:hypothetical protein HK097_000611, partial [Rhizophlyctis rosea]